MRALKAPGPDGFSGNLSMDNFNKSHIALIPKALCPESVDQFCPIALRNYSYKDHCKDHCKPFEAHPAYQHFTTTKCIISRRKIQNNILIAHESFHVLKLKKSTKIYEMGIKLDTNKAYEQIE